jgi:hypothetical protein
MGAEKTMADAENNQTPASAPAAPKGAAEVFSREYVHELREEAKGYRLKVQEAESAKAASDAAVEAARREATETVSKAQAAANERVVRAELKAVATKAGMIDLDGLKLADLSKVKLAESGEVEGADEVMAALKEAKPYLFKQPPTSSGQPGSAPPPDKNTNKKASEMTREEYAAAKKSLPR